MNTYNFEYNRIGSNELESILLLAHNLEEAENILIAIVSDVCFYTSTKE